MAHTSWPRWEHDASFPFCMHACCRPVVFSILLPFRPHQVFLLLCIADWMVHSMWKSGKDPDSFSIPYLTALGDLFGTAFLALSFHFLWVIGDQDSDVGDWGPNLACCPELTQCLLWLLSDQIWCFFVGHFLPSWTGTFSSLEGNKAQGFYDSS